MCKILGLIPRITHKRGVGEEREGWGEGDGRTENNGVVHGVF